MSGENPSNLHIQGTELHPEIPRFNVQTKAMLYVNVEMLTCADPAIVCLKSSRGHESRVLKSNIVKIRPLNTGENAVEVSYEKEEAQS